MPTLAASQLNQAVLAELAADSELTNLLGAGKVYDQPPPGAQFPYVNLGETQTRNWSTQTSQGLEHRLTLHVWSRHKGQLEAQQIVQRLHDLLELAPLTMADHTLVNLRVTFWAVLPLGDGRTLHGVIRLRAVSEPAG